MNQQGEVTEFHQKQQNAIYEFISVGLIHRTILTPTNFLAGARHSRAIKASTICRTLSNFIHVF